MDYYRPESRRCISIRIIMMASTEVITISKPGDIHRVTDANILRYIFMIGLLSTIHDYVV